MKELLYLTICWNNVCVGRLYKNEKGEYKYFPDYENIILTTEKFGMPKNLLITPQVIWGSMPKFIEERIKLDPDLKNNCMLITDKLSIRAN